MAKRGRPRITEDERRAKVLSLVVRGDGCWQWDGCHRKEDGRPTYGGKYAYRLVYSYLRPLTPGLVLDHLCQNPRCVNPAHLDEVTQSENLRRSDAPGDNCQKGKTHCPQGHPYDGSNLYVAPNGNRHCRACRSAAKVRYRERQNKGIQFMSI
jgi:hypothetical protein